MLRSKLLEHLQVKPHVGKRSLDAGLSCINANLPNKLARDIFKDRFTARARVSARAIISSLSMLSSPRRRVSEEERQNINNLCYFIHRAAAMQKELSRRHTRPLLIKSRRRRARGKGGRKETSREKEGWQRVESCVLNIPWSDHPVSRPLIFELAGHQRGRERKSVRQGQQGQTATHAAVLLLFKKVC